MLPTLPYHRLQFHFRTHDPLYLPGYKGSPWRGLFGHCFKTVICPFNTSRCHTCLIRQHCHYLQVFETPASLAQRKTLNGTDHYPHPFILTPPLDRRSTIPAGETFTSELILLSPAFSLFPFLVATFDLMGKRGLGPNRSHFELANIQVQQSQDWHTLFDAQDNMLQSLPPPQHPLLPTIAPTHLTLQLLTPLRLKSQGRFTHDLPFQLLLQAILRRLKDLITLYGSPEDNAEGVTDPLTLLTPAALIDCQHSDLYWFDVKRFSSRQHRQLAFGGLEGTVTYQGDLAPFLPWLKLGEALHIGGLTSFGFGKYQIE